MEHLSTILPNEIRLGLARHNLSKDNVQMPEDQNTPQGDPVAPGTTEPVTATPPATVSEPEAVKEPTQTTEDAEELKKQLKKLEMHNNQLLNKQQKWEKAQEDSRLAELSEVERLKEELAQARQEKQLSDAKSFRDKVIEDYPDDNTRKLARALIDANETNLTWGDVSDYDEAKADLTRQLDALRGSPEATKPVAPQGEVHPNNPIPGKEAIDPAQSDLMDEAVRTGNWTQVLHSVPSIKAMAGTFDPE